MEGENKSLKIVPAYTNLIMRLPTKLIAFVGVFASLHTILYLMPYGLWRNWAIFIQPIEGIILGPLGGFLTALIGSTAARVIVPTEAWMFGITAEPLGVLTAGFLAKGKWKPILMLYIVMLGAYFAHPFGRLLPVWAMIDILLALALIYPTAKLGRNLFEENIKRLSISLALLYFITVTTDSLVRVFLFIPAGLYSLFFFGPSPEAVYEAVCYAFIGGAIESFIEDTLAIIISFLVGVPLLTAFKRLLNLRGPLS